jgi:2-keto-4-pentenoate hydratase
MANLLEASTIDWLEQHLKAPESVPELLDRSPGLDVPDAYRVQQALIARRLESGDQVIGYKAALTSKAMQEKEGIPEPLLGTLLLSRLKDEGAPIALRGFLRATLEPEIGMILGRDLAGPGVTPQAAWSAVSGFCAAAELGDMRSAGKRSIQHAIACNTFNGGYVFGGRVHAPSGIDLRTEGMVLAKNGIHQASATAAEVLGNPIHAVAFIANKLGELGLGLKAGMVLLTGSIVSSIPIASGDTVQIRFSTLGDLTMRFAD